VIRRAAPLSGRFGAECVRTQIDEESPVALLQVCFSYLIVVTFVRDKIVLGAADEFSLGDA
jgi:hypothetical protein